MSKKTKKFDKEKFKSCDPLRSNKNRISTVQDLIDNNQTPLTATGGLVSTPPIQPIIQRNIALGERVIYFNNSGIIFGPQRNTNEMSGEAKSGFPSDTIDIVVGFNDGGAPCDGQIVNVNAITDAARIYVSRAVKVDTMFGLAREEPDRPEKARSAVVMKADNARIVGRSGIKLITGRAQGVKGAGQKGEKNSKGGDFQQAATIDLIAGNNISSWEIPFPEAMKPIMNVAAQFIPWFEPEYRYLQPAVMGDNLKICLKELSDMIDSVASATMTTNTILMGAFQTLGVIFTAFVPLAPLGAIMTAIAQGINQFGIGPSWSIQQQMTSWNSNFFEETATRYICSKNVNIT